MTRMILIAVHDSAAAFRAAEAAMQLAARLGDVVHAVWVHEPPRDGSPEVQIPSPAAQPVFSHLATLARRESILLSTQEVNGKLVRVILNLIDTVRPELLVVAAVDRPGSAIPYLGSQTLRLLEFSPIPVLVVPMTDDRHPPFEP